MVDAGTFIYYNAYELLRYSVTLAILKIFGFANLLCKLLHYTKNPGNCNLLQSPGRNIFVPRYHPHSDCKADTLPLCNGSTRAGLLCVHLAGSEAKRALSRAKPLAAAAVLSV